MGCICSKNPSYVLDYADTPRGRSTGGSKGVGVGGVSASTAYKKHYAALEDDGRRVKRGSSSSGSSVRWRTRSSPFAKRRGETPPLTPGSRNPAAFGIVPGQLEAEQLAAGWPAWLTAVAGEAILGWIPRRSDSFEKLYKIGQGTYSSVYKARCLETGKFVALKKVRFDSLEPESVRFMAREIQILRKLDHPNILKLLGLVTSGISCSIYLVFEYMEHDLAGLMANPSIQLTEPQIKCYMQQLLKGLDHCHSRGILHRDIKGSNLLIDNKGILKIGDFGLANYFTPGEKQMLTSRVVTLWYRPPELLLGATDYGVGVDLWSTGCILAELLYGKPILPGKTEVFSFSTFVSVPTMDIMGRNFNSECTPTLAGQRIIEKSIHVEQLHKIFKLCGSPTSDYWKKFYRATPFLRSQRPYKCCIEETFKDFSPPALAFVQNLLSLEPAGRGDAHHALKNEFFTTKPIPCDPSTLPTYPASKEYDAKLRAEEARKQRAIRTKGQAQKPTRRSSPVTRVEPRSSNAAEIMSQRKCNGHVPIISGTPLILQRALGPGSSGPMINTLVSGFLTGKLQKGHREVTSPEKSLLQSARKPTAELSETYKELKHSQGQRLKRLEHLDTFTHKDTNGRYQESRQKTLGPVGGNKKKHFSGPLLPSSANIDDVLEKHDQQMRLAARKARRATYVK